METCQQLVLSPVSLFSLLEDLVHRFGAPGLLFLPGQGSHPFQISGRAPGRLTEKVRICYKQKHGTKRSPLSRSKCTLVSSVPGPYGRMQSASPHCPCPDLTFLNLFSSSWPLAMSFLFSFSFLTFSLC